MHVDHDHVCLGGCVARCLGEAHCTLRTARRARALVTGDADRLPRPVVGRPCQLSHVAGGRVRGPLDQLVDIALGGDGELFELELPVVGVLQLAHALHADVVAATLEHGPREVDTEVFLQERQILAGQLVLQGFGGRCDDGALAGQHRRHQVAHRLARARTGLHHDVATAGNRRADETRHLALARSVLGVGERGSDTGKCRVDLHQGNSARAASSSVASKSGQARSVK